MEGPEKTQDDDTVFVTEDIKKKKKILKRSELDKQLTTRMTYKKFLCIVTLPERAGWVEALDCEGWVGEGLGNGGHLGPVLRCCHPS